MSELEIKFQKSEIFNKYQNIWKRRNKNSEIQNYFNSYEYKKGLNIWKQNQEKNAYINSLYTDSKDHFRYLENKFNQKEKNLKKQIINLKRQMSEFDKKIKQTRPTIYFFSAMFTLFLTTISAITVKINILNLNNFQWWETMGIIIGIIAAIFIVAIVFYLIAWYFFRRHWKKLDI